WLVEQRTFINASAFVRPGGRFHHVVRDVKEMSKGLTNEDHLLVMAGTNNVETTSVKRLVDDVKKLINNINETNLILSALPMRRDRPDLDF
ncbi:hypothetical protein J6590_055296, partial [Homalodisca vitripennis]